MPIVLAALREPMLRLAARVADGAFANFLPLSSAETVVRAFGSPDKELACRFFSFLGPEDEALEQAKRVFVAYATVPVYTAFFRWLGHGDELEPLLGRGRRATGGARSSSLPRRSSGTSSCSGRSRRSASGWRRSAPPGSTPACSRSSARRPSCRR